MENKDILVQPVDLPEGEGFNTVHKSVVGAVNELHAELSSAKQSASEADLKAQGVKEQMADLETKVNSIELKAGETGPAGPQGPQGEKGADGAPGAAGKSAMDIANEIRVANGQEPFATADEFLASLQGANGKDGLDGRDGTDAYVDPASLAENEALIKKYVAKRDLKDEEGNDIYAKAADMSKKADKSYVDEYLGSKAEATAVEALMTAIENKQDKIAEGTYILKKDTYTKDEVDQKILSAQVGAVDKEAVVAEVDRIIKEDTENVIVSTSELNEKLVDYATKAELENKAMMPGPQGEAGKDGKDGKDGAVGKSAFEIANELQPENEKFADEAEFILSLKGEKGEAGAAGRDGVDGKDGAAGKDGADGKSAFEIAKELNPELADETAFIASLKGEKGDAGEKGADGAQGEKGADGVAGESAYEIAKRNGFDGDEEAWLESLKGEKGEAGAAAEPVDTTNFVQKEEIADFVKASDIPAQKTLEELGGITQTGVETIINGYNFLSSEAIKKMIDDAIAAALSNNNNGGNNDTPAPSDNPTNPVIDDSEWAWTKYFVIPKGTQMVSNDISTFFGDTFTLDDWFGPNEDMKNTTVEVRYLATVADTTLSGPTYLVDDLSTVNIVRDIRNTWKDGLRCPLDEIVDATEYKQELANVIGSANHGLMRYDGESILESTGSTVGCGALFMIRKLKAGKTIPEYSIGEKIA